LVIQLYFIGRPLKKHLKLNLNKFPIVPNSLRDDPKIDKARKEVEVDIARVFHHYYLDKFGKRPPSPDPAQFEPVEFLVEEDGFRFTGAGYGDYPAAKNSGSNQLGQAFMRWFLHDHCGVTYFAHMHKYLNRKLHRGFGNLRINRILDGDVPDYVCARNTRSICIGEAKGRYSSISFGNKEFQTWRDQFKRIEISDDSAIPVATKGYIVATRFATEAHPRVQSAIYAEDPLTPGEREMDTLDDPEIAIGVIRYHYARLTEKLNMNLLSAALDTGSQIPSQLQQSAVVWELQLTPEGMPKRYVGGYWFNGTGPPPWRTEGDKIIHSPTNPFLLNSEGSTFLGLEESIFMQIASLARNGSDTEFSIRQFPDPGPYYSAISTLRDGSIIAPAEFMQPVDAIQY
jgi:hypothetical protein